MEARWTSNSKVVGSSPIGGVTEIFLRRPRYLSRLGHADNSDLIFACLRIDVLFYSEYAGIQCYNIFSILHLFVTSLVSEFKVSSIHLDAYFRVRLVVYSIQDMMLCVAEVDRTFCFQEQ